MNAIPTDPKIISPDKPVYTKSKYGPFKFKDIKHPAFSISDSKGTAFVVQEIVLRKIPGEMNLIEVVLIMPNPENVEVVYKKITPKSEESGEMEGQSHQVGPNKDQESEVSGNSIGNEKDVVVRGK